VIIDIELVHSKFSCVQKKEDRSLRAEMGLSHPGPQIASESSQVLCIRSTRIGNEIGLAIDPPPGPNSEDAEFLNRTFY
jgi:hypothetical protein